MQHIAAGDGWTIVSDIVGRHPVPGISGCPLAIDSPREAREVLLEIIWHRNADALAVRALVDQLLRRPNSRPPVEGLTGHRSYLGTRP